MPSAKILSEKQAYVADLKAKFESAVSGCVVAYGGINVENDTKLRKELREAGVDYMVVKNTMLRLAVKGTSLEGLLYLVPPYSQLERHDASWIPQPSDVNGSQNVT